MTDYTAARPLGPGWHRLDSSVRETDGVELVVRSLYRHLPAPSMYCANDPVHRATVYCDTCAERLCPDCARTVHAGHVVHPYGYVDWSVRAGHGFTKEMGELIVDAASALKAGLEEIMPKMGPWRHGVVFNRGESSSAAEGGSVRKLERSDHVPEAPPRPPEAGETPECSSGKRTQLLADGPTPAPGTAVEAEAE